MSVALKLVNGVPRMVNVGLDDLSDVSLTSPGNGDVIKFSGSNQQWENLPDATSGASEIYDDVVVVGVGGLDNGTPITLPNGETYTDKDLEVYRNGIFLEPGGVDYNYVGVAPRSQINFVEDLVEGERIHLRIEGAAGSIYDETVVVGAEGVSTGSPITLPNSGIYTGDELQVYLNGDFMEEGIDYNLPAGSPPYTTVEMTFDLVEGDRLRFRID